MNAPMEKYYNIPPVGLKPKWVWDLMRLNEILAAMERYSEANKPIPIEWITELRELISQFERGTK